MKQNFSTWWQSLDFRRTFPLDSTRAKNDCTRLGFPIPRIRGKASGPQHIKLDASRHRRFAESKSNCNFRARLDLRKYYLFLLHWNIALAIHNSSELIAP